VCANGRSTGVGPLGLEAGLEKARDALSGILLGGRAELPTGSRFGTRHAERIAFTAVVVAAASAIRLALGTQQIGLSAAIFFPVILVCALFAGWQYGVAAWIGSTITAALITRTHIPGANLGLVLFAVSGAAQVAIAAFARAMLLDREILRHRLFKLVDASEGFVFVTDGKGRPLEPHPRWTALTGMQWDDYRGHGWLKAIHPDERQHFPLHGIPNDGKSFHVELRLRDGAGGDWRWFDMRAVPVFDQGGKVTEWIGSFRDIHEGKLEAEKQQLMTSDARHRLKNLMAIIEALAKYSAPRPGVDEGVDKFLKRFTGRLHALTAASDLLLAGNKGAIEANAVIRATLAPFMSDLPPRITIEGPELQLSEQFGGGLALAVHELATNAIKYGALSVPQGTVAFVWTANATPEGEDIVFDWKERGGPLALTPNHEGFGTRMIKTVTARENTGAVRIDYEPDGLHCRISFTRAQAKV
jgi:PAS domain S-box-containing protein